MKFKAKSIGRYCYAAILIFGVPVLINECYKHDGYVTVKDS